jgi:hypothetical protein
MKTALALAGLAATLSLHAATREVQAQQIAVGSGSLTVRQADDATGTLPKEQVIGSPDTIFEFRVPRDFENYRGFEMAFIADSNDTLYVSVRYQIDWPGHESGRQIGDAIVTLLSPRTNYLELIDLSDTLRTRYRFRDQVRVMLAFKDAAGDAVEGVLVRSLAFLYDAADPPAGANGSPGIAGPRGEAGLQGANGIVGPAGPQGPKGATGATGLQGLAGAKGPAGATGATGPMGPPGPPAQPD